MDIKNKLYFLTFANTSYMKTDRIIKQAKSFNMFDYTLSLSELDIPQFINKHQDFIKKHKYGYGFWIWKPKIILKTLENMNVNDILVYCDAGFYLNNKGLDRFKYYLSMLENKESICVFNASDTYKAQHFVKNDAIMSYWPEFNNEWNTCCYAGIMIIKKNQKTLELIKDWLTLCENYKYLDKTRSIKYKDPQYYKGNDCDNGLFNLCLSKHKNIVHKITPDEINLYNSVGKQLAHTNINQKDVDWSSLDHIPFQVRRITPKFCGDI